MTIAVRIAENGSQNNWLFEKIFDATSDEWNTFKSNLLEKKPLSAPYLVVNRADTWSHLCQDLFLPSIWESSFKMKNLAQKIFAILQDLFTFLPRLLSLTRVPKRQDHPLYKYLQTENADNRLLNRDSIFIQTKIYPLDSTNLSLEEIHFVLPTEKFTALSAEPFPYIELPKYAIENKKEWMILDLELAPKIEIVGL